MALRLAHPNHLVLLQILSSMQKSLLWEHKSYPNHDKPCMQNKVRLEVRKKQEKSKTKIKTLSVKELQHYQESPKTHLKHSAMLSLLNPPVMKLKCAQHGSCVPSEKRRECYQEIYFYSRAQRTLCVTRTLQFNTRLWRTIAGKHTRTQTSVLSESHSWPQVITNKWLLSDFSSSTST